MAKVIDGCVAGGQASYCFAWIGGNGGAAVKIRHVIIDKVCAAVPCMCTVQRRVAKSEISGVA